METKKTIKLTLDVEIDIAGKVPSDDVIESALCDVLSEKPTLTDRGNGSFGSTGA